MILGLLLCSLCRSALLPFIRGHNSPDLAGEADRIISMEFCFQLLCWLDCLESDSIDASEQFRLPLASFSVLSQQFIVSRACHEL